MAALKARVGLIQCGFCSLAPGNELWDALGRLVRSASPVTQALNELARDAMGSLNAVDTAHGFVICGYIHTIRLDLSKDSIQLGDHLIYYVQLCLNGLLALRVLIPSGCVHNNKSYRAILCPVGCAAG